MRLVSIVLGEIVTIMTVLLIAGHGSWAGRVLISVGDTHGLHAGDLPVLVMWASAMVSCVWLWRHGAP